MLELLVYFNLIFLNFVIDRVDQYCIYSIDFIIVS